jgi:hypothetical protein
MRSEGKRERTSNQATNRYMYEHFWYEPVHLMQFEYQLLTAGCFRKIRGRHSASSRAQAAGHAPTAGLLPLARAGSCVVQVALMLWRCPTSAYLKVCERRLTRSSSIASSQTCPARCSLWRHIPDLLSMADEMMPTSSAIHKRATAITIVAEARRSHEKARRARENP